MVRMSLVAPNFEGGQMPLQCGQTGGSRFVCYRLCGSRDGSELCSPGCMLVNALLDQLYSAHNRLLWDPSSKNTTHAVQYGHPL